MWLLESFIGATDVFCCCFPCVAYLQMMVAMKRVKWDGVTTGSGLTASVAKVHEELKVLTGSHNSKIFTDGRAIGLWFVALPQACMRSELSGESWLFRT